MKTVVSVDLVSKQLGCFTIDYKKNKTIYSSRTLA